MNKRNEVMDKLSLDRFYEVNNYYKELQSKANDFYKELKEMNNNLDLDEIRKKCTYQEVKDIYTTMKYCTSDKTIIDEVINIMNLKKEEEYPQILGVQYFPEILQFDFLNSKEQIQLDKVLREAFSNYSKRCELHHLGEEKLKALIDCGILEKVYVLSCGCGSFECSEVSIKQSELDGYINYWNVSMERETTDEEDKEFHYGCIEIPCWNDTTDEITNLKEFEEYGYKRIRYSFKKDADLTLENL